MYTIQPRSSMPLPTAYMSSVGEATAKTDMSGSPMMYSPSIDSIAAHQRWR